MRKRACVQREAAKWEAALALAHNKVSSPEALALAAGAYSSVCAAQSGQKEDDAEENAEDDPVANAEDDPVANAEEGSTAERTEP